MSGIFFKVMEKEWRYNKIGHELVIIEAEWWAYGVLYHPL